jgi:NlpC/P60 family putative phage cell wall peptidase
LDDTELIAEIKSWKGTKWIHGQCLKGVGTDCVRFVCAIGKFAGWVQSDYKVPLYDVDWALHNKVSMLVSEIQQFAVEIQKPYQVGDIFLFTYGQCASHAGIYIGNNEMVHSYRGMGVIQSELRHYWQHFHSAWRPFGVKA